MRESHSGVMLLGVDPGLRITGYGLVRCLPGRLAHVAHGAIRTTKGDRATRLLQIHESLKGLLVDHQVDEVAVEKQFVAVNASTAFVIGEARAAAILAAAASKIPVFEYTPAEVKQAVTSYGRSGKQQIQEMVRIQFGLDTAPEPADAADALAIAICHAGRRSQPALERTSASILIRAALRAQQRIPAGG